MTITDFENWLDAAAPDDSVEEVYGLYSAVSEEETNGIWEIQLSDQKIFLKVGHVPETLLIASKQAKEHFLKRLRELYMGENENENVDPESWYGFHSNMSNPKA